MPTVISFQSKYASLSSFSESFRSESQDIPQSHLQRTRDEPTNPKVSPKFRSVASVSNFKHPSSSSPQRGPSPGTTSPRGGQSTNTYSLHRSTSIAMQFLFINNKKISLTTVFFLINSSHTTNSKFQLHPNFTRTFLGQSHFSPKGIRTRNRPFRDAIYVRRKSQKRWFWARFGRLHQFAPNSAHHLSDKLQEIHIS